MGDDRHHRRQRRRLRAPVFGLGLATGNSLALVPAELIQVRIVHGSAHGLFDTIAIPEGLTLISYMFMHTDFLHLTSNMLFLWVFGDNVEDAMGHAKYVAFYLLCGIAAGLPARPGAADVPAAADGGKWRCCGNHCSLPDLAPACAGLGFGFPCHPLARDRGLDSRIVGGHAAVRMALVNRGDQIAWWAHIGGLAAGGLLIPLMRRPDVVLF